MMIFPNAADLFAPSTPTENSPEPKLTDAAAQDFASLLAASYALPTPAHTNIAFTPEPVKVDERSSLAITDASVNRPAENIVSAMPSGTNFSHNFSTIPPETEAATIAISSASSTNLEPVFGRDEQLFPASTAIPLKENNATTLLAKTAATLAQTGKEQVKPEAVPATESQPVQAIQNQAASAISLPTTETAQSALNSPSDVQAAHEMKESESADPLIQSRTASPSIADENTLQSVRPSQPGLAKASAPTSELSELTAQALTTTADKPATFKIDAPPVLPLTDIASAPDPNTVRPPVSSVVSGETESADKPAENLAADAPITMSPTNSVVIVAKVSSAPAQAATKSVENIDIEGLPVENVTLTAAAPLPQTAATTESVLVKNDPAHSIVPTTTNAMPDSIAARPIPVGNQIYFEIVDATKQVHIDDVSAFRKIQVEIKNVIASLQMTTPPIAAPPSSMVTELPTATTLPAQPEINPPLTAVPNTTAEYNVQIMAENISPTRSVSDESPLPTLNVQSNETSAIAIEAAAAQPTKENSRLPQTKENSRLQFELVNPSPAPQASAPPNTTIRTAAPLGTKEISVMPVGQLPLRQNDQPETVSAAQVFPALTSSQPNESLLPTHDIPATAPPAIVRQTAEVITATSANLQPQEIQTLRLQLRPEQLGEVAIELARDEAGKIHISVVASSADAQQALTQEAGQLQQTLEQNGVNLARLEILNASHSQLFSQSQQQSQQQSQSQAENIFSQDNDMSAPLTFTNNDHSEADKLVSLHA